MRLWQTERPSCDVCARVKGRGSEGEGVQRDAIKTSFKHNF